MSDFERCSQCGKSLQADSRTCPRCGFLLPAPVSERPNLLLRSVSSEIPAQQWFIAAAEALVGRGGAADVDVPHHLVSRKHARIVRSGAGFVLEDLGSQNSTYLNGERVVAPLAIEDGDEIEFGRVVVRATVLPADAAELPAAEEPIFTMTVGVADALAIAPLLSSGQTRIGLAPATAEPTTAPESAPCESDEQLVAQVNGTRNGDTTGAHVSSDQRAIDVVESDASNSGPNVAEIGGETGARQAVPLAALADLAEGARSLAENLSMLESGLAAARERFERVGGRSALLGLLAQAEKTHINALDVRELMALGEWSEPLVRLLEAQLALTDHLWPQPGAGAGSSGQEE